MKAITIRQPWATLIATGEKHFETRSWKPSAALYSQDLAIHAAAGKPYRWERELCERPEFRQALARHGYNSIDDLPRGEILCVVTLGRCYPTPGSWKIPHFPENLSDIEHLFGDYTPGRYAWHLRALRRLAERVPVRGNQGLWNWDVDPTELEYEDVEPKDCMTFTEALALCDANGTLTDSMKQEWLGNGGF